MGSAEEGLTREEEPLEEGSSTAALGLNASREASLGEVVSRCYDGASILVSERNKTPAKASQGYTK